MKKLFFVLIALSISSLHGMEVPDKQDYKEIDSSEIVITPPNYLTLLEIFYHFAYNIFPITDIAKHIFAVMPGMDSINTEIPILLTQAEKEAKELFPRERLTKCIKAKLDNYGYCYTAELLRRNLKRENISICDVKCPWGSSANLLHYIAFHHRSNIQNLNYLDTARLYLDVAGKNAWNLLTAKTTHAWATPLHEAAANGNAAIVKLFLDVAGEHAQALISMQDRMQRTAFVWTTPAVQKIIKPYLKIEDYSNGPTTCSLM